MTTPSTIDTTIAITIGVMCLCLLIALMFYAIDMFKKEDKDNDNKR